MIESGKFFFLARPRRFGKSLMVDTLANILQGNRKLFEGTYIWDKYAFDPSPVLRFSMNDLRAGSFEVNVKLLMSSIASKAEGVRHSTGYISGGTILPFCTAHKWCVQKVWQAGRSPD